MARPIKEGLDYFPLDCDIDQDDKIALVEAQHGIVGFGIIIKLLMKIYNNSYFYEWTEKQQLLFSKRVNVDINSINVIINDCLKWGLFNEKMYGTYKILTSKGIQRRYLEAIGRRQKVKIIENYLLLEKTDINVYKNLVIVNINEVNDNINTQSKVKESKVNKSIVNNTETTIENIIDIIQKDINPSLNSFELEMTQVWFNEWDNKEIILQAIKETALNKATSLKYTDSILRNWKSKNVNSLEDINRIKSSFSNSKGKRERVVEAPDWMKNHQQQTPKQNDEEIDPKELDKLLKSFK